VQLVGASTYSSRIRRYASSAHDTSARLVRCRIAVEQARMSFRLSHGLPAAGPGL